MMALRIASLVAALVTITLNATYGFKTSTVLEYAILFAALNAALDVAKCACLAGAGRAWRNGQRVGAVILFLLFWPLLANSLWCGLSEVAFNRASEQTRFAADAQARTLAAEAHKKAASERADLEASPHYKSSTACALPKTSRERTLCTSHAAATARLHAAADALARQPADDPAPQITLLAAWTGYDLAVLLLATALWPIALAELAGSVGFWLTSKPGRTERRWNRFRKQKRQDTPPAATNASQPVPRANAPDKIRWPVIAP